MRSAITDPLSALPLLPAVIVLAILSALAAQPKLWSGHTPGAEPAFSKEMRGESNGETGKGFEETPRLDV